MDHIAEILLQLFAILVAAKVGHEIFRRLGQPTVVGEILGGVVAGPAVSVSPSPTIRSDPTRSGPSRC